MREQLPTDTKLTCDKTPWGSTGNANDPQRCGKKAVVRFKETCGCGKWDMSFNVCAECYIVVKTQRECFSVSLDLPWVDPHAKP